MSAPESPNVGCDGAAVRFPPPLVYLVSLATGVLLHGFVAALPLAIGTGARFAVALVPVSLAIVYAIAVRAEEAHLERKFGAAYLAYKASVRRWR